MMIHDGWNRTGPERTPTMRQQAQHSSLEIKQQNYYSLQLIIPFQPSGHVQGGKWIGMVAIYAPRVPCVTRK